MIKAISFDGNGVLYYREKDVADSLLEYIKENYKSDMELSENSSKFRELLERSFRNEFSKTEMLEKYLDYACITDLNQRKDIIEKEMEFSRSVQLFPTESETILELNKRGFKMGMITNTFQSAAEKADWFIRIGLGCVVEEVVSSIEIGISKPDAGIYEEFARRVGYKPNEVAYVAHDEEELVGAYKAGMVTISFNYSGQYKADYRLSVFKDILDIPELY
jgi:FMN phosphatase YigB (HAD superfamily)